MSGSVPFTKNGCSDPHYGSPLLNCRFKVSGHTHGKLRHVNVGNGLSADYTLKLFERPELGANLFRGIKERGQGHEAADGQILKRSCLANQIEGAVCVDAGLGRLA